MWLRKKIIALIPKQIKKKLLHYKAMLLDGYSTRSYSVEGEDILLQRIFYGKTSGFFVDIGAHHPIRFSNTYKLYLQGWRGVNVEPNPDDFSLIEKYRAKDINVNCGIAQVKASLDFFMFDEPALNTFDKLLCDNRIEDGTYKHTKTIKVEVVPLSEILSKHTKDGVNIDFLNVDVEGFDLEVLKSNDWVKYRPSWVLVEQLNLDNIESLDFALHVYMHSQNYILFARTFNTLFYRNKAES